MFAKYGQTFAEYLPDVLLKWLGGKHLESTVCQMFAKHLAWDWFILFTT